MGKGALFHLLNPGAEDAHRHLVFLLARNGTGMAADAAVLIDDKAKILSTHSRLRDHRAICAARSRHETSNGWRNSGLDRDCRTISAIGIEEIFWLSRFSPVQHSRSPRAQVRPAAEALGSAGRPSSPAGLPGRAAGSPFSVRLHQNPHLPMSPFAHSLVIPSGFCALSTHNLLLATLLIQGSGQTRTPRFCPAAPVLESPSQYAVWQRSGQARSHLPDGSQS